jgi:hypothetical protein
MVPHLFSLHLQGSSDVSRPIPNPCLLAGTNLTYQRDDVYSECVSHNCSSGVFGFGFSPPSSSHLSPEDDDEPSNYTFNGTGDPEECRDTILQVFDLANCTQWGACLHDHYMWPPINNSGTFLVGVCGIYTHTYCGKKYFYIERILFFFSNKISWNGCARPNLNVDIGPPHKFSVSIFM